MGLSLSHVFVGSKGLEDSLIQEYWSRIALSVSEDRLVECLRLIEPGVERVTLVPTVEDGRDWAPFLRLKGEEQPVFLGSLGDGMHRVFHLALGLLNASDGLLLIDEFENGLHYSVQTEIWRFIFRIAEKYNVQVFATTHSSDCVKAFEAAAIETEEEGVLVYLGREGNSIVAREFDEDRLETAVEMGLELRG